MSCEPPVFLVGSMISGTILLRSMLDQHPDIAFNLESEFLVTSISLERRLTRPVPPSLYVPECAGGRRKVLLRLVKADAQRIVIKEGLIDPEM